MQYKFINKNDDNKNLIIFFNGWAMNESPIKHLKNDDFDILMLYDYRKIDFDFSMIDLSKYQNKYLICWSMGVYCANLYYNNLKDFNKKIAINGTSKIIDNNYGIPEKVYNLTVKFLNESSVDKFISNMFQGGIINPNIKIEKNISELKNELISIQNLQISNTLDYDIAIISSNDKIVPTKNQINFWENTNPKVKIKNIDSTHCPFEIYNSWHQILC